MIPDPFQDGVTSVLKVDWTLRLETPLCIRNGTKSALKSTGAGKKTRNIAMDFFWNKEKSGDEVEVSEAAFCVVVEKNEATGKDEAVPRYRVSGKSVRGALRSWTITHLVDEDFQVLFTETKKASDDKETATKAADDRKKLWEKALTFPGFELVWDLFGGVIGGDDKAADMPARNGRLSCLTNPLDNRADKPLLKGSWQPGANSNFGPKNAFRHITVRGPLDRITQAAKSGGLHQFVEFSPNQSISVSFRVANPTPPDLGLFSVWRQEIDSGMLRMGGLSSIGRGRMKVEKASYVLAGRDEDLADFARLPGTDVADDLFANLWKVRKLDISDETQPNCAVEDLRRKMNEAPANAAA